MSLGLIVSTEVLMDQIEKELLKLKQERTDIDKVLRKNTSEKYRLEQKLMSLDTKRAAHFMKRNR